MAPKALAARIAGLYESLLSFYGKQGWWPIPSLAGKAGFDARGYHPGNYDQPRSSRGRFEVALGAVLTQNTAWTNVEKALARLHAEGIGLPADIHVLTHERLADLIRPAGYYNQKARKLAGMARLFGAKDALSLKGAPPRDVLLALWGIGPETADSILLYAFKVPVFVVDAYMRRILERIGLIPQRAGYADIQRLFHAALPANHAVYNEFHALLVEHAKQHCRAKPICIACPVKSCRYRTAARR